MANLCGLDLKFVYKNPTDTKYTEPLVSSEWEAINDIEIGGGRNLLLNTKELKGFQYATTDKYLDFNICRTTKGASGYLDTFKTTTIAPPEGNTRCKFLC